MSVATVRRRRMRLRRGLTLLGFGALLAFCIGVTRPVAASAEGGGQLVAEPVASAATAGLRQLFGASPEEAPGEAWGLGQASGENLHIVRYTGQGGWEDVPDPTDESGATVPLRGFGVPEVTSAGRTTAKGGVVTVASLGAESEHLPREVLIARDPGGPFRAIAAPPREAPATEEPEKEEEAPVEEPEEEEPPKEPQVELREEEQLFRTKGDKGPAVDLAAVEEPDGKTGAFIVPAVGPKEFNNSVLHFDGTRWIREPICLGGFVAATRECAEPPVSGKFSVFAIEAAGPGQEWMLAQSPGNKKQYEAVVLLKREEGEWVKQKLGGPLGAIFAKKSPVVGSVSPVIEVRQPGQPLTVTSQGAWIDTEVTVGARASDATIYYDFATGEVAGSWCDLEASIQEPSRHEICNFPLGSELPAGESRSFAWPGNGQPGHFGTRAITGVGQGAMLIFENGAFSRIPLSGNGGASGGAALSSPEPHTEETESLAELEGWLSPASSSGPAYHLTRAPVPSGLAPWPLPFRRPLLAVAPQPGALVGPLTSEALAVGADGEVARYLPGVGWQPESLGAGSGTRPTPNLRGVAWPTPNFAYAVGDEGAMWMWREWTGLWEADPGAPPNLVRGNFTGIAFDPNDPERGYAVGKQGLLLSYGKRWTQESLPVGISPEANITSIAFAGDEALATWTLAVPRKGDVGPGAEPEYIGGLIINTGFGWRVDEGAGAALAEVEDGVRGYAPWQVAALPDGGAVIVGLEGGVIEREAVGAPWHLVSGPLLGYPSAVAAIREGGQLRALVSVAAPQKGEVVGERDAAVDRAQAVGQPAEGQAPLLTEPYPLPTGGLLVRQTASGWHDEERDSFAQPPDPTDQKSAEEFGLDLPREPDPVLGILLNAEGTEGWAVGGQTGEGAEINLGAYIGEGLQTASVQRYGPSAAAPANASGVPILANPDEATFAIGGGAQCEGACADLVNTGIGPDVWLRAAVGRAASIGGVRAFLYTGGGVSEKLELSKVSRRQFGEEENSYASRLGSEAGAMPVFAAPSKSDLYESTLTAFEAAFSGFSLPLGAGAGAGIEQVADGGGERPAGNYSYAFDSVDSTGQNAVHVIVLDEANAPTPQPVLCWLGSQLALAKAEGVPAIVVGSRDAQGEAELTQLLVTGSSPSCPQAAPGGASAYFFKTEGNTQSILAYGTATLPDYGTGSLGYMSIANPNFQQRTPASGFLLASVNVAARSRTTNVAPVSVRLIPSIGSLALNALDGTFLRRSQTALFEALARRPVAGSGCVAVSDVCRPVGPDPYAQIPARCINGHGYLGGSCTSEIEPEYRFRSSRPDIANFVKVDPNSTNPRAVFLGSNGKPVPDETSGLLCAFNSGTTTVSVEAGGLAYSVPVTVQQGSVAQPCGTVPRTDLAARQPNVETPPPPIEGEPHFTQGNNPVPVPPAPVLPSTPAPIPTPPAAPAPIPVAHHVPAKPPAPLQLPFLFSNPLITPIPVIVPPTPPAAAEPAPPTGTSPVTQPAVSPEPEEEEEAAFDLVHHAVAYLPGGRPAPALQLGSVASAGGGGGAPSGLLPALVILTAVALAGAARPRLRRSPEPAFHRNRPQRRPPR